MSEFQVIRLAAKQNARRRQSRRAGSSRRRTMGGAAAGISVFLLLSVFGCGTNETLILKAFEGRDAGAGQAGAGPVVDCSVEFITPEPAGLGLVLGGSQDACAGPNVSSEIVVASSGQRVELVVNGLSAGTQFVVDPEATAFRAVLAGRGERSNSLLARSYMADGRTCETLFPLDVLVACEGPSCLLASSEDNAGVLPLSGDTDSDQEGFQTQFVITTGADQVSLLVDGQPSGVQPVISNGSAVFSAVTVAEGDGRLVQAVCTDGDGIAVVSATGSFTVGDSACQISFVAPGVGATSALSLGGNASSCNSEFSHSFIVSSTAQTVELTVNGAALPAQTVNGLFSIFDDVVLTNRGTTNNRLIVVGTAADGRTCQAVFPGAVLVDCDAPSCTLVDPSDGRAFLNSGDDDDTSSEQSDGIQIDLDVATDTPDVQLLVDGQPSPIPPQYSSGLASFSAVSLAEGAVRRVQAVCTDESGNETRSTVRQWAVDTTPCSLTLGAAQSLAALVTPMDDAEPTVAGIQLTSKGTVTGEACQAVRIVNCNETFGPFSDDALVGSNWTLPLTLPEQSGQWSVCAEVRDIAGNTSSAMGTFEVRTELPELQIASPGDSTVLTVLDDLTADNGTCDVPVVVYCKDLGSPVSLFANGSRVEAPPGSGNALLTDCVADSSVPFPYLGQAVFDSAGLLSADGGTVSLEARQTVVGLLGSSETAGAVTLTTDCVAPRPTFSSSLNCGGKASLGVPANVVVFNGSSLGVELLVDPADGPEVSLGFGALGSLVDVFSAVDLGGRGEALLTAVLLDPAGNEGTQTCRLTVVDEPTVSISSPASSSVLTSDTADCSGDPGLQIAVVATTNAPDGSSVELSLGGGAVAVGGLASGSITGCVNAPEGSDQTLLITVDDPARPDLGSASITVSVDTQAPVEVIAQPSIAVVARREGLVQFNWTAVSDVGGGALSAYVLGCSSETIATETEWLASRQLTVDAVPAAAGVDESEIVSGFRVGSTVFCLLRGQDAAEALTPIDVAANVEVSLNFLLANYEVDDYTVGIELSVAPVGDINGDGFDDFASGATGGGTLLFFGGGNVDGQPDVVLTSLEPSFGGKLGILGDINGDGRPDFSVSAFRSATGGQGIVNGSVYIFYGRDSSQPWPSVIDVDGALGCGADVCLQGTTDNALFGFNATGADLDGDQISDVIVGAPLDDEGKVYVLRGGSQFSGLPSGSIITVPGSNPDGLVLQPPGGNTSFGDAVAAVGPLLQGSSAPSALVISSSDSGGTLWLLPATSFTGSGLKAGPTPTVIASSIRVTPVKAVGDLNGDQLPDLIVGASGGGADVYLRNINGTFNTTAGGAVSTLAFLDDLAVGDSYGSAIAVGFHPGLGLLGDLDDDGIGELLFGARFTASTDATLIYGGQGAVPRTQAEYTYTTANTRAIVSFVGDVNGDSFNDFAVLDSGTGINRLVLHY